MIADADPHGFVTFDSAANQLRGYTHDGVLRWTEDDVSPGEVHCAEACPDAGFSVQGPKGFPAETSSIVWRSGKTSRTERNFDDPAVNLFWTAGPDRWVAADSAGMVWNDGKQRSKKIAGWPAGAQGKTSQDGKKLLVSVPEGDSMEAAWKGFLVGMDDARPGSPVPLSRKLPGPVGCLSREGDWGVTLGNDSQRVSLPEGKRLEAFGVFSSECVANDELVFSGEYEADEEGGRQKLELRSIPTDAEAGATAFGSSRISVHRECGVLTSRGILNSLTLGTDARPTDHKVQDAVVVDNGTVLAVAHDGKPKKFHLRKTDEGCLIQP
ncbi:hypothetical protein [Streptomyces sp. cmx-18-6]|uniref:hypothetical protein n=1 Tax=Streptomyces sp. cmx-18-6 TaxID=2790930 RepID=UPI0039812C48